MTGKTVFFEEFDSIYYYYGATKSWNMKGMHFHKQYEIILFMSDGTRLEIGNRVYQVGKGDIFFINNKEYHRSEGKEGEDYIRYVLMFDPEFLAQMMPAFGYDFASLFDEVEEDIVNRMHLSEKNLKIVEEKMHQVEQSISQEMEDSHNKIRLKLSLLDLINTLDVMYYSFSRTGEGRIEAISMTGDLNENVVPYRDRIEQIKNYIGLHAEEKLELDDIAGHFYMNKYYLSHYFKKETGFTLNQYITNQKILAAKKMLKSGMSVTDVAMQLSYVRVSHFISVFKKMTGTTPKKYAQEQKDKNT